MKRLLLAVAILALVFPGLRQAEARTDISIDFFYDNLGDAGSWVEVGDYGYCWQPSVAVSNTSWRPYSDGYWAYTDVGWTWVSYEDFGWATYHYGRWMRIRGRGWVWVPGREWGPAWVSWRTGGDYVGWAPLPPRRAGEYWDESPITARVDIDFDIGPAYYNFIDVRYIGEPVLRERIFAADQNATYVTKTVNVTNITYTNSTVYNYGPDYNTLSRYSTRPIQRLSLQRETNVDPATAAQSKSLMKVQGDKLVVAAPQQLQKPTKTIAPKVVKEKVTLAQAPVERGWEPVGDQKAQTELKEKMKKEDPKSVPPPTIQASEKTATSPTATSPLATSPRATTASATPATGASPAASATPAIVAKPSASPTKNKNKNKRNETVSPAPNASASVSPALSPATARDKKKNKPNEKVSPPAAPSTSVPPATTPVPPKDKRKNKQRENVAPRASVPPPPPQMKHKEPAPDMTKPEAAVEKPKREAPADIPRPKQEPAQERVAPPPAANAPVNPPPSTRDEGKKKSKGKNEPATSPTP
jgi:hypothetical protein